MRKPLIPVTLLYILMLSAGCNSSDDRLRELSRECLRQQAEQNAQTAQQGQRIAETAKELVQADVQARREIIEFQQSVREDLKTERSNLDRQHEDLEKERQRIAASRYRAPLIASAITNAALLIACLLPLVLCCCVLSRLGKENVDESLSELLIQELASDRSTLLPDSRPPTLEHHVTAALPGPEASSPDGAVPSV